MTTKDLIDEAISLPVEERARIVDSLLKSLNPTDPVVDEKWMREAKRRLEDLRSGRIEPVPGEVVFENIWRRFGS